MLFDGHSLWLIFPLPPSTYKETLKIVVVRLQLYWQLEL